MIKQLIVAYTLLIFSLPMSLYSQDLRLFNRGEVIIDGDLEISNKRISIKEILKRPRKAYEWQGWIAFDNKHGLGPRGGNVFLFIAESNIILREISPPWATDKNILSETKYSLPKDSDLDPSSTKYKIINFVNDELWATLTDYGKHIIADSTPPPDYLARLNIVDGESRFYNVDSFDDKYRRNRMPIIVDVIAEDDNIYILGAREHIFRKVDNDAVLNRLKEVFVAFHLNEENEYFNEINVKNIHWTKQ